MSSASCGRSFTKTHFSTAVASAFAWFCAAALLIAAGLYAPALGAQSAQPATSAAAMAMRSILLWPNGAPGALTGGGTQDTPQLDIYEPASNPTQTGVIVCPGGGYRSLSLIHEGSDIAAWLVAHGVAGFVLHYRLGPRYHYPAQFDDITRAMRYVRANAAALGIDPKHVGVWGFSAGGNLATMISTHYDAGHADSSDPIEKAGSRPDFTILSYAKVTLHPDGSQGTALLYLLGPNPDPKLVDSLSDETQVTADTPPAFIYQTANDPQVPPINAVLYFEALSKAGVPVEMHIFENGPHGTFLGQTFPNIPALAVWPTLLANWMQAHGWMQGASATPTPAGGK
jgi:acetyl esterase/lipase